MQRWFLAHERAKVMKTNWFYILLALAEGERHGSGIMRDVLELTAGELRLWPATLYGSLDELAEHGWIEEVADGRERSGESARLRFYRLTAQGRRELKAETKRLESLASVARMRLTGEG